MRVKPIILLGPGILAALVAVGLLVPQVLHRESAATQDAGPSQFEVVATVNGEPIVYGELELRGGRTKAALEQSVLVKLQQIEARRAGLVGDISYRAWVADMKRVNKARHSQVDKGGIVYGPVTYDEKEYFDERVRELGKSLQARLPVSDQEITRYYTENRQQFSLGDSRRVAGIFVATKDGVERLTEIERKLSAGDSFDAIYNEVRSGVYGSVLTARERTFDYRTFRMDSRTSPALVRAVNKLSTGEVTSIVADNDSVGIYKCVAKHSLGYIALKQVKQSITNDLRAQKYDALVKQWRAGAKVEVTKAGADLGIK